MEKKHLILALVVVTLLLISAQSTFAFGGPTYPLSRWPHFRPPLNACLHRAPARLCPGDQVLDTLSCRCTQSDRAPDSLPLPAGSWHPAPSHLLRPYALAHD